MVDHTSSQSSFLSPVSIADDTVSAVFTSPTSFLGVAGLVCVLAEGFNAILVATYYLSAPSEGCGGGEPTS